VIYKNEKGTEKKKSQIFRIIFYPLKKIPLKNGIKITLKRGLFFASPLPIAIGGLRISNVE